MKQYRVEAYNSPHSGRTSPHYITAHDAPAALRTFNRQHSDRVFRCMWELVPPGELFGTATEENPDD